MKTDRTTITLILTLLLSFSVRYPLASQVPRDQVEGNLIQFNDNGAWCWYQDERAVIDTHNNLLILGSDASRYGTGGPSRDGFVEGLVYNLETGAIDRTLFRDTGCDDHNAPGFLIRPDGQYIGFYADHYDYYSRFRIYNGNSWSAEQTFNWVPVFDGGNYNACYSNLFYLSEEDRLYNFVRSYVKSPNYLESIDGGDTWSYGGLLTEPDQSIGYVNGYFKYSSNGTDRIGFVATEYHPRDFNTSLYHGYIKGGQTFTSDGLLLDDDIHDQVAPGVTELTLIFAANTEVRGATMTRCWNMDLQEYPDGTLVLLFKARADNSQYDHRFFYARYNGVNWTSTYLGKAGGKLYASEEDYTGLAAVDPNNPDIIYISTPIDPRDDTDYGVHEIFRGESSDGGATWRWTQITRNSVRDNLRPIIPAWNQEGIAVLWMRGSYFSAQSFDMTIVGLIDYPDRAVERMTYVDANSMNSFFTDGSPLVMSGPDAGEGAADNQWHERTGAGNSGSVLTSAGSGAEDAPALKTRIRTPSAGTYDVWVNFWADPDADWRIRAGFAISSIRLFRQMACKQVEPGAHHAEIILSSGGTAALYQAYLGRAATSADSIIEIFIDDYAFLNGTTSTPAGDEVRTWYDGVSYTSSAYLAVYADSLELADTLGSHAFLRIGSNSDWQLESSAGWLVPDITSGYGDAEIRLTTEANTADTSRMAVITVTSGNVETQAVYVFQLPPDKSLMVSADNLMVAREEGSQAVFTITSNTAWTLTCPQAWLSLSHLFGSNNKEITISASENPFSTGREALVTVEAAGLDPIGIVVEQEANPWLETSETEIGLSALNSSRGYFSIHSNVSWSITTPEDWLAVAPETGSWDANLTVTAQGNTSEASRNAALTIAAAGVSDQVIAVTQAGTGIESISAETQTFVRMYPNPVTDALTVELDEYPAVLQLYTVQGRLLETVPADHAGNTIGFGNISQGVYLLKITSKHDSLVKRIIKN